MKLSIWSDCALVERLRALNENGESATEMANILSREFAICITRNAVISKAGRLKLALKNGNAGNGNARMRRSAAMKLIRAKRVTRSQLITKSNAESVARKANIHHAPIPSADPFTPDDGIDDDVPHSQRKTLINLERDDCRWPIGDPRDADFRFCGGEILMGSSYCERHFKRAHQPPNPCRAGYAVPNYAVPKEQHRNPTKTPQKEDA